jgi:YD repeat-containing protein
MRATILIACAALLLTATAAAANRQHGLSYDNDGRTTQATDRAAGQRNADGARKRHAHRDHPRGRPVVADKPNIFRSYAKASTSRECLTGATLAILERGERHFGVRFSIVSTCRPGATIAGSRHPSQHRFGKAVDFIPPRTLSKAAVVRWFYANAPGVTMTYANMAHVHFDTGPFHKLAHAGPRRVRYARIAHR